MASRSSTPAVPGAFPKIPDDFLKDRQSSNTPPPIPGAWQHYSSHDSQGSGSDAPADAESVLPQSTTAEPEQLSATDLKKPRRPRTKSSLSEAGTQTSDVERPQRPRLTQPKLAQPSQGISKDAGKSTKGKAPAASIHSVMPEQSTIPAYWDETPVFRVKLLAWKIWKARHDLIVAYFYANRFDKHSEFKSNPYHPRLQAVYQQIDWQAPKKLVSELKIELDENPLIRAYNRFVVTTLSSSYEGSLILRHLAEQDALRSSKICPRIGPTWTTAWAFADRYVKDLNRERVAHRIEHDKVDPVTAWKELANSLWYDYANDEEIAAMLDDVKKTTPYFKR